MQAVIIRVEKITANIFHFNGDLNRLNIHFGNFFTEKNAHAKKMLNILIIIRLQQKNTTQSTDRHS